MGLETLVNTWQEFLDSLDTTGGHVFVLLLLMSIGVGMHLGSIPKGEDVIIAALGALLGALKGMGRNSRKP